jgi:hydrogenase nickel incorporation protein HypA/HybF
MHELGIVFYIIDDAEKVAKENELTKIQSVTMELGEVSGVIPSYLTDAWNWAVKKHDIMKDAELICESLPAVTYCEDCKKEYGTVEHGRICPYCGSENTYLLKGSEINIKQIEGC